MGVSGAGGDAPADDAAGVDLPLSGPRPGFGDTLPVAALGASIRYFVRAEGASGAAAVAGLRFPIFAPNAGGTLRVRAPLPSDPSSGSAAGTFLVAGGGPIPTNFLNTSGRAITLAPIEGRSRVASQWDPELAAAYTVLAGDWRLGVDGGGGAVDVMLGLSGTEFGRVGDGSVMRFVPGGPAYAPLFPDAGGSGAVALVADCPGSAYPVTTAWVYLPDQAAGPLGAAGAAQGGHGYYSQPNTAGLYTPAAGDPFLGVLGLRAAVFPPGGAGVMGAPEASFPSAPYGGATPPAGGGGTKLLRDFETQVLTPARTSAIYQIAGTGGAAAAGGVIDLVPATGAALGAVPAAGPAGLALSLVAGLTGPTGVSGPTGPTGPSGPARLAATPQGLLATFSADLAEWWSLLLAQSGDGGQTLELTALGDTLRAAMLSNQLFLVISDPAVFAEGPNGEPPLVSLPYRFTAQSRLDAARAGVPPEVVARLGSIMGVAYASLPYFQHALRGLLTAEEYGKWGAALATAGESGRVTVADWSFDASPGRWGSAAPGGGTLLVLKFADRPMGSLIDDLSLWTLPVPFNGGSAAAVQAVQKRLQQIAADARARAASEPELAYFADTVLEAWNGVLFLDVFVPTNQFPDQLRGLASGIEQAAFRAHHLGVNLSPVSVTDGGIVPADASLFGLISYASPAHLVYRGAPYDFKVLSLRVLFANSQVTSFSSQVELLLRQLFAEPAQRADRQIADTLVLNGFFQKHAGEDSYVFAEQGEDLFDVSSQVVGGATISRAQFLTVVPKGGFKPDSVVTSRFQLAGWLRFARLEAIDLFSFGVEDGQSAADFPAAGLSFANLVVQMTAPAGGGAPSFAFLSGGMVLDASASTARSGSLFRRFPLLLASPVQSGADASPADLAFIPVEIPMSTGSLGDPWFGVTMVLNLGSRGSLSARGGFQATILLAWAAGRGEPNVAVGVQLPGSQPGQKSLTILGPLKLDIAHIFLFPQSGGEEAYLMRFQNIALGFLGVRFPPAGQTNALLFGNPDPAAGQSALGWYAAYRKDPGPTGPTGPSGPSGRAVASIAPPSEVEPSAKALPAPLASSTPVRP